MPNAQHEEWLRALPKAVGVSVDTGRCPVCLELGRLTLPTEAYARWRAGEPIAVAWPESRPSQWRQLESGFHPHCTDDYHERDLMPNNMDRENHDFNKRNAESNEKIAAMLGQIDDTLIELTVVLQDIRDGKKRSGND